MSQRFAGQTAIITGGAKGIGRATVRRFLSEGGKAGVVDLESVDSSWITSLREEVGPDAERLVYIAADATDEQRVAAVVAEVADRLGPPVILVNNLGFGSNVIPIDEISVEAWNRFMNINVTTAFMMTRAVVPHMRSQRDGRIVNLSSITGRSVSEVANIAYHASKAAILGFTRKLAYEEGPHGIRANAVAPGTVFTERVKARYDSLGVEARDEMLASFPLRRAAQPEEIAAAILFLASDDASYVTGAVLDVNGGRFMG
ncbi:SDR family NAD(P)-dependent oxidoreductase [Thalassobaculum sp.]|uniref:SDR family NAD(P)-dependent oxidoreductase n=1 Tax=Thalassobaculum sp. TaxID=2022740 RepID=UPI0032EFC33E